MPSEPFDLVQAGFGSRAWGLCFGWSWTDAVSLSFGIQIPSKPREENKLHVGRDINMISGLSPTLFPLRTKDIEMIRNRTLLGMN